MGEYAKAEPLFQEVLRIYRKVRGNEHPDTAYKLVDLAGLYRAMGEYTKAEPLLQEALRISQKVFGPNHLTTAFSSMPWAGLYADLQASTPKPNRFFRKRSGSGRRSWALENAETAERPH